MAKRGRLKTLLNWIKPDSLKSVIHILLAVIGAVGGLIAGYKFYYYDHAAYNPRANVSSTLEWRPSSLDNRCEAIFHVQLENSGIATFDVSTIQVRVWAFDAKEVIGQKAAYLSLEEMEKGEVLFDSKDPSFKPTFEATETPFVGHYALSARFHRSFQWLIAPDDARPNVYFRTDFTLKDNETRWFTAAWGPTCGKAQTTTPSPSPSPAK